MIALSLGLALAAFTALALSDQIHHREVFGRLPASRRVLALRLGGWTALGLSLWACLTAKVTIAVGFVLWLGLLTSAALAVAFTLTYRKPIAALARRLASAPLSILTKRAARSKA